MKTLEPTPVKYFIGILYSDTDLLDQALEQCQARLGELSTRSDPFLFDCTHYYDEEMGTPIHRLFVALDALDDPGKLARFKNICHEIEEDLAADGKRKVNLDIGYLDLHKVILASAKYNGQKIYIGEGIYADPTYVFESGQFHAVENTFPDFKNGQYDSVFLSLRDCYKTQLKTTR